LLRMVLISIVIVLFKCESSEEYYRKRLQLEQFKGKIISKYINKNAHGNPEFRIKDGNNIYEYSECERWIDLYDSSKINDYIKKDSGNREILLIRKKEQDTLIIKYDRDGIDYGIRSRFW
jgi:hypothetical protein